MCNGGEQYLNVHYNMTKRCALQRSVVTGIISRGGYIIPINSFKQQLQFVTRIAQLTRTANLPSNFPRVLFIHQRTPRSNKYTSNLTEICVMGGTVLKCPLQYDKQMCTAEVSSNRDHLQRRMLGECPMMDPIPVTPFQKG